MDELEGLNDRQISVVLAFIDERNLMAAAKKANVARSTVYSWLEKPEFRAAIVKARTRFFDEALDRANGAMARAVDRLVEQLDHGSSSIRYKAASKLVDLGMEIRSRADEARLAEIEDKAERILALSQRPTVPLPAKETDAEDNPSPVEEDKK